MSEPAFPRLRPRQGNIHGRAHSGPSTDEFRILCEEAAKGYSISSCAAASGLTLMLVRKWMERGQRALEKAYNDDDLTDSEQWLAEFTDAFLHARALGVRALEDTSTKRADEGSGTWSEAITKLERGHRGEFGKFDQQQQSGVTIVLNQTLDRGEQWEVIDADARVVEELPAAPAAAALPPVDSTG